MASRTVPAATAAPAMPAPKAHAHVQFPLPDGAPATAVAAGEFAERVFALTGGLAVVLAALERDAIERDLSESAPVFGPTDTGALLRMCVALAQELHDRTGEFGDRLMACGPAQRAPAPASVSKAAA